MSYETNLGIYLQAYDQASSTISSVASNLSQVDAVTQKVATSTGYMGDAYQNAKTATDSATKSFSDQVVQANSLALAGATLFMSFERVENSEVMLDRANLNVQKSTNALTSAQNTYNKAVEQYGSDSQQATDAAARLATAQDSLTVAQERVGVAQNNLNNSMIYAALTVVPSFLTMSKALDISMKTLAIDAVAAFGAFAIGYTVLNSIPEPMRQTAAVIAFVSGALVALAIAAYAAWEGLTMGAATPFITASLVAVGVAASGLIMMMQSYGSSVVGATSTALSGLAAVTAAENTFISAESTRYQNELTTISAYWNVRLGLTKTFLETIDSEINTYYTAEETAAQTAYQVEVDAANAAYTQQLTDYSSYWKSKLGIQTSELSTVDSEIESHYNQQISDTNSFYDDLISASMAGLNNLRAARSGDLDNLEENMLSQKISLEDAHDHGLLTDAEYQKQLNDLNQTYNDNRSRISDHYRLEELQAEKDQTAAAVPIEQARTDAITTIQYQQNDDLLAAQATYTMITTTGQQTLNDTLTCLAQTLADTITSIENQKNTALQLAYTQNETALQTHWDNLASINQAGVNTAIQIFSQYTDALGNTGSYRGALVSNYPTEYHTVGTVTGPGGVAHVMQHGGIVEQPTFALLGEAGPEAVIPLGSRSLGGVTVNVNSPLIVVEGNADRATIEEAARLVMSQLRNVTVEATSSGAPATQKRIRLGNRWSGF